MDGRGAGPPGEGRSGRPGSRVKVWVVAARVFALPASTMSVAFGTVLAITIGQAAFRPGLFAASLLGMALLHTGANLLNDVYDFKKGIDRQVHPASGAVVRRWITPHEAAVAAVLCLAMGSLLGLYIVSRVGLPILGIGAVGVLIGVLYTWGPWPLKDHALGDLAVFLDFGILGSLGAWTVQTGGLSWVPVVWAVPMSLLVVAILHANNWRDIASDSGRGVQTVAGSLGDAWSERYYEALLFGPFAFVVVLVLVGRVAGLSPAMPVTFLVTLLAVPLAVRLVRTGARRHERVGGGSAGRTDETNGTDRTDGTYGTNGTDGTNAGGLGPTEAGGGGGGQAFAALDGATARLNLVFGLLCIAALGLHELVG